MSEMWRRWEGQVVNGEFPLLHYLGGSDHSAVFRTERRAGAPEKAAIKLIPAGADSDNQLRRWKQSAELAHPHLVRVMESGRCELGGSPFLFVVMEAAEEDLSQILPERPLTAEEVRQLLPTVLDALAYLHGKGWVHGRLRPSNILAAGDQLKVSADTLRASGEPVAATSGSTDSDGYYAPESSSGKLTASSDVWSLGITLVEILTQRRPAWDPVKASAPTVPPGLPEPFAEIARRSLQIDPKQRWTVAEISGALQGKPPKAAKVGPAAPRSPMAAVSTGKKKSAPWGLLGLIAAIIVIALIVWAVSHHRGASSTENRDFQPGLSGTSSSQPTTTSNPSSGNGSGSATKGAVLKQVMPEISPSAQRSIEGRINIGVRVKVDASGNVTAAKLISRGPSRYFANAALEAAREWKFTPPQVQNQPVGSEWNLRFVLRRSGIDATSVHVAP